MIKKFLMGDYASWLIVRLSVYPMFAFFQFLQCVVDGFKEFYESITDSDWTIPISKETYERAKVKYRV